MRIAVIEDEAPIREGMVHILHKMNPEYVVVGSAEDGQKGYELICRERPDLVIMDIQMPKMDGLTMLGKVREQKIPCRAIVLTAYSEFEYAQQAIRYGVVSYLLKPMKIPELKQALKQAEEVIQQERSTEHVFTPDNILLGCLSGQLDPDDAFHRMTYKKYGFTVEEPAELMMIWLGTGYAAQKKKAREFLEGISAHTVQYSVYIREMDGWELLLMILYRLPPGESRYDAYKKNIFPVLCRELHPPVVGVWRRLDHLIDVPKILPELKDELEWNLWYKGSELIQRDNIEKLQTVPMQYPSELEVRAKKALLKREREELIACYEQLFQYFLQDIHRPSQIKEYLIRFNWNLANAQKERNESADLRIQKILQGIAVAVTWEQIKEAMQEFMEIIQFSLQEVNEPSVSDMVRKAMGLIKKYYSQGITLEEAARKLFVSEEYLSAQFKKETGATFTETVRKYRIEKVKKLLLETHLKLNQIAELAGYSDPKYMSRVFKEEVGMLPNEFRKSVH